MGTNDDVNDDERESLQTLKSNLEQNDNKNVYKYLSEMMTFYLCLLKNPKYLILDISQCITSNTSENEEDDKLSIEWISSFQSLSKNKFVSHFGIGQIQCDDIDLLKQRYNDLQTKWAELFQDIPFEQFEPNEQALENDLEAKELSLEEYEAFLAQKMMRN